MRETISESENGKSIYLYDENDFLVKLTDFDQLGNVSMTIDYLYDAKGNNIERVVKDSVGRLIRRLCFRFDGQGREIEYTEYDSQGNLQFTDIFSKNQNI